MASPHSDVTDKTNLFIDREEEEEEEESGMENKARTKREKIRRRDFLIALSLYSRFGGRRCRPSTLLEKSKTTMDHSRPRRH